MQCMLDKPSRTVRAWPSLLQVLAPCMKGGASASCCAILAGQFAPQTHLNFASCLCHPGFWQASGESGRQLGCQLSCVPFS